MQNCLILSILEQSAILSSIILLHCPNHPKFLPFLPNNARSPKNFQKMVCNDSEVLSSGHDLNGVTELCDTDQSLKFGRAPLIENPISPFYCILYIVKWPSLLLKVDLFWIFGDFSAKNWKTYRLLSSLLVRHPPSMALWWLSISEVFGRTSVF